MFYVYAHVKPDGEIFYVGKGTKKRAWDKHHRNRHWKHIVSKYGYSVQILGEFETEEDAFKEELSVIQHFSKFGTLCNMVKGGGGVTGYKHTKEAKQKISIFLKGNTHTKGYKHTDEAKKKLREAAKGNPTRFKSLNVFVFNGVEYLGSIEASIKTGIPRTTLLRYAENNKNGWSTYRTAPAKSE